MSEFMRFRRGIERILALAHKPHLSDQDRERLYFAVKQSRTGQGPPALSPELENLRGRLVKLLEEADEELAAAQVQALEALAWKQLPIA